MEVEIDRVEIISLCKVCHADAEVAKLVNGRWPLLEALELIDTAVLLGRLLACQQISRPQRKRSELT